MEIIVIHDKGGTQAKKSWQEHKTTVESYRSADQYPRPDK